MNSLYLSIKNYWWPYNLLGEAKLRTEWAERQYIHYKRWMKKATQGQRKISKCESIWVGFHDEVKKVIPQKNKLRTKNENSGLAWDVDDTFGTTGYKERTRIKAKFACVGQTEDLSSYSWKFYFLYKMQYDHLLKEEVTILVESSLKQSRDDTTMTLRRGWC